MKFEKFQVILESEQSVDQAGNRTGQHNDTEHILCMYTGQHNDLEHILCMYTGQHNDLEHILCMYTDFQFVKTGIFSTHLNFSSLIFSRWYVKVCAVLHKSIDVFVLLYR